MEITNKFNQLPKKQPLYKFYKINYKEIKILKYINKIFNSNKFLANNKIQFKTNNILVCHSIIHNNCQQMAYYL